MIDHQQVIHYMSLALILAEKGLYTTNPNPRVGCVIVQNDEIVGQGFHQVSGTEHAEIHALNQAGDKAVGSDVYVTLEPCCHFGKTPPCSVALINAGVKRVFIAMLDPNPLVAGKGKEQLLQAGIEVYDDFLAKQAKALNIGFIHRMKTGLPWVRAKMAMSLDGKTAMADGKSKWITGAEARMDVQKLRARSSALLTGIGTIEYDDPSLNVRIENDLNPDLSVLQPIRIILDSSGKLSGNEKIFSLDGKIIVYTLNDQLSEKLAGLGQVEIVLAKSENKQIDLKFLLEDLAKRQINELHVEAGATLSGRFIEQNLINELVVYMAPKLMGSTGRPLFKLPLDSMEQSIELHISDIERIGNDYKCTAVFKA